ncbi:butyrophilin-like protein 10 isoform X2 [Seriola aureovittata]|uniref:butyrophilin-like protein 10 isoform X2 n=1 Tax=Seriola aureovittata TaxID=2871759 RepID=UPI0024BEC641|nr:butyrophilin-like protein 10 isoform X2 [Seriola aureovittata]
MKMKLFIFLSLFFVAGRVTASVNQTMEAEEGGSVFFQCHLDHQVNVSGSPVKWSKDGSSNVVHLYIRRQDQADAQKEEFRNRTLLFHEGLSRGNVTLQLSSVRPSDAGGYRCYVRLQGASCYFTLTVGRKGQTNRAQQGDSNTTRPPPEDLTEPDDTRRRLREVTAGIVLTVVGCFGFLVLMICRTTLIHSRRHEVGAGQET